MIQNAADSRPDTRDTHAICSAKARVRRAARKPRPQVRRARPSCAQAAIETAAENPAATAAVAFAVVSVLGPIGLIRAGLLAARVAPLVGLGIRAVEGARSPNSPRSPDHA